MIIGGGFGGLAAARSLKRAPVDVTLIDRANHHLFQPLLYQVATAGLSAPAIAAPIRHTLRQHKNLSVLMAHVTQIDLSAREVICGDRRVAFDYLIMAAGAQTSYFGNDAWATVAPGLKTLSDAFEIRARVLEAFEKAELAQDPADREALLTFAVIGAGPTGVELAGTLAEIARHTLRDEFRAIDPTAAHVLLIEGSERVLGSFSAESSARATAQLERLGVRVMCSQRVSHIDTIGVTLQGATEPIRCATVLWAAGVCASPLAAALATQAGEECDRAGRIAVTPSLNLKSFPNVFVIGDMARVPEHVGPIPGVAPAAKQMGRLAARNLLALIAGQAPQPFKYVDYGSLATIGRNSAVVELGKLKLSGFPAWVFWLWIHIFFLIGFRNRFVVMMDWAWSYISFERSARIVIPARKPRQ